MRCRRLGNVGRMWTRYLQGCEVRSQTFRLVPTSRTTWLSTRVSSNSPQNTHTIAMLSKTPLLHSERATFTWALSRVVSLKPLKVLKEPLILTKSHSLMLRAIEWQSWALQTFIRSKLVTVEPKATISLLPLYSKVDTLTRILGIIKRAILKFVRRLKSSRKNFALVISLSAPIIE